MDKKIILITGASKGLGLSLAENLGQAGHKLILTARTEESLKKVCTKYDATYIAGDITKKETHEALYQKVKKIGKLDVLINNAGVALPIAFEQSTEEDFDRVININTKAPIFLVQKLLPLMIAQGSGHIIQILSGLVKQTKQNRTLYTASKYALCGFSKALRTEVQSKGIRITEIYPSGMKTQLFDNYSRDISDYMDPQNVATLIRHIVETKDICPDEITINRIVKNRLLACFCI